MFVLVTEGEESARLATFHHEFVQAYCGTTYDSVGSSLAPYKALMYMPSVQNSTLYQEQVVNTGLQTTFQTYWEELNEGGKCSN